MVLLRCSTVRCPMGAPAGRTDRVGRLRRADRCLLPAQLRQYARFAPNRRASLLATPWPPRWRPIRCSGSVSPRSSERRSRSSPGALDSGAPPPAADPLDVAAAAYAPRPTGWVKLVTAAGEEALRRTPSARTRRAGWSRQRLREESASTRGQTKAETERLRTELESAKRERNRFTASCAAPSATSSGARPRCASCRARWTPRGRTGRPRCRPPRARPGGSRRGSRRPRRPWRPPARRRARVAASRTCAYGCCSTPCWRRPRGCAGSSRCRPCPYGRRRPSTRSNRGA